MDNTALAAKNGTYNNVFIATIATGFLAFFVSEHRKEVLNPALFTSVGFIALGLSIASIFWWLSFFDRRDWLKLSPEGLVFRRWIFPFTPMTRIAWADIEYVYIQQQSGKGAFSETLCIGHKGRSKEIKLKVTGFNTSSAQILSVLYHYSTEYHFHCLGMKVKR